MLHFLPRELLLLLIDYSSDHITIYELERVLPECVHTIRCAVRVISSCHNCYIPSDYPNLEQIELPLTPRSPHEVDAIVRHPRLLRFHLIFSELSLWPGITLKNLDVYWFWLLSIFLHNYTQRRKLQPGTRIRLQRIGSSPDMLVMSKHIYMSDPCMIALRNSDTLKKAIQQSGIQDLWFLSTAESLGKFVTKRVHYIVDLSTDIKSLPLRNTFRDRVGCRLHFIGPGHKLLELLRKLIPKLRSEPIYVRIPLLYTENLILALMMQPFDEFDVIISEPCQLQSLPVMLNKTLRLFRLPNTEPFCDIPEYPVYSSVEECMRANI